MGDPSVFPCQVVMATRPIAVCGRRTEVIGSVGRRGGGGAGVEAESETRSLSDMSVKRIRNHEKGELVMVVCLC